MRKIQKIKQMGRREGEGREEDIVREGRSNRPTEERARQRRAEETVEEREGEGGRDRSLKVGM